jgi:hypothetical protein
MHVWSGAHEMPLPQSFPAGRGIADTLQTSIATMNNDAFTFIVMFMYYVLCVGFITYLLFLFMHECNNKKEFVQCSAAPRPHNSQLVATVVSAFVRSCAAFAARGGLVRSV